MIVSSVRNRTSAISAPTPAEGSVEMIVSGWIRLSYRMPEHDVDGEQRGQDQHRLAGERFLIRLRGAGELAGDGGRQAHFDFGLVNGRNGIAERNALRQIEGDGGRRELALMRQRERRDALREMGERRQRHVDAARRLHVDFVQELRGSAHHCCSSASTT